jgi:hypothetical protein
MCERELRKSKIPSLSPNLSLSLNGRKKREKDKKRKSNEGQILLY